MNDNDNSPDIFDLNDWVVLNHSETWNAIKYLSPEHQFPLLFKLWDIHGRPDIRD